MQTKTFITTHCPNCKTKGCSFCNNKGQIAVLNTPDANQIVQNKFYSYIEQQREKTFISGLKNYYNQNVEYCEMLIAKFQK